MDAAEPGNLVVEVPGLSVCALTWGPAEGPLALLLHGFPDTAWGWRSVGPLLAARGWRVVAPFSRGYAPTGLAPDGCYEPGALVHDAIALHAALAGDERAMLVGHDWGALTTYGVGVAAPGLFGTLVALAVPPVPTLLRVLRGPRGVVLGLRQVRRSWYMFANQIPGAAERAFAPLVAKLWADWSPGYRADDDLAYLADAMPSHVHRRAAITYYRASFQPWRRPPAYRDEMRAVFGAPRTPVLYLHGADDGCMLADIGSRALPDLAEGSAVEIVPDCGHFLQIERPVDVTERILRFAAESGSVA